MTLTRLLLEYKRNRKATKWWEFDKRKALHREVNKEVNLLSKQ
tara:strand:+ start:8538 stop:8666 length:129 start_codon:yes stop_codon:yes gene_type:complete